MPRGRFYRAPTGARVRATSEDIVSGNVRIGRCKLTGSFGHLVKSHIIPQALTETVSKGESLTQRGPNGRLIRPWSSWYDRRLVMSRLFKHEPIPDPLTGELADNSYREIPFYRFYFDGLVAHMHIQDDAHHVAEMGPTMVGPEGELHFLTLPSSKSVHMRRFLDEALSYPPASLSGE